MQSNSLCFATFLVCGAIVANLLISYFISGGHGPSDDCPQETDQGAEAANEKANPSDPARPVIPKPRAQRRTNDREDNYDMTDWTTPTTAIGTSILALVGIGALILTYCSNLQNRQQFRASQRAYVVLGTKEGTVADLIPRSPKPGETVGVVLYFQNAGHLVARHFTYSVFGSNVALRGPDPDSCKRPGAHKMMDIDIAGEGLYPVALGESEKGPSKYPISAYDYKNLIAGKFKPDSSVAGGWIDGQFEYCEDSSYSCTTFRLFYMGSPYQRYGIQCMKDCSKSPEYCYPADEVSSQEKNQ